MKYSNFLMLASTWNPTKRTGKHADTKIGRVCQQSLNFKIVELKPFKKNSWIKNFKIIENFQKYLEGKVQILRWQALAPDQSDRYSFYLTKPWLQSVSTAAKARNKGQNVNFKEQTRISLKATKSMPLSQSPTCTNLSTQSKQKTNTLP